MDKIYVKVTDSCPRERRALELVMELIRRRKKKGVRRACLWYKRQWKSEGCGLGKPHQATPSHTKLHRVQRQIGS